MNRYKITPEGHRLITTAVKGEWPTWSDEKTVVERADMANILIKLEEGLSAEDGTFSVFDYEELSHLHIEPLQIRQLVKEKLLEKLESEEEEEKRESSVGDTVDGFLYEKDLELRMDDIDAELATCRVSRKPPSIALIRKHLAARRELNKLLGRGGSFLL